MGNNNEVEKWKMNCVFCNHQMNWSCDYSFDDYGHEGDGLITIYRCRNCGAIAEIRDREFGEVKEC